MTQSSEMPLASIVMPCYNAEVHLNSSVGSLLNQTLTNWELIAVDDGSTDGTVTKLRLFKDARIRILTQHHLGVSAARNAGLAIARGDYIAFLDSDDTWEPDFLGEMYAALKNRPDAVLAYCGWQNLGLPGGRGKPFIPPDYEGPSKMESLLEGCRWPIHACLTRRAAISAAGGFEPSLRIGEDYRLWLELSYSGLIVRVPEVYAYYHHHDGIQATRNRSLGMLETLRAKVFFIDRHPEVIALLGRHRIEELTWGALIRQANELSWTGDLVNARPVQRKAIFSGRGTMRDRFRMLPSLLPLRVHQLLIRLMEQKSRSQTADSGKHDPIRRS